MNSKVSGAIANRLANAVLQFFAFEFSKVKKNQEYLKTKDGWINFSIGLTTEDGAVAQSIWFQGGNARVRNNIDGVDTKLILQDTGVLAQLGSAPVDDLVGEEEGPARCEYVSEGGVRCRNHARPGSRFCGVHEKMALVDPSAISASASSDDSLV